MTGNLYRKGRSGGFGAMQTPATKKFLPFSKFCEPCNHPN